jgi:hypothetical protein
MAGIGALELPRYFRQPESTFGKSIQRSWDFTTLFIYNPFKGIVNGRDLEFPPVIQPYHVLDVTIPTYSFKKEYIMYGQVPRSFPVLDFEGFNIDIVLEEDEQGTVEYFINWNQRNIIKKNGVYNAPDNAKIHAFVVEVKDKMGIPIVYYNFHDLFFLNASTANYSYQTNSSITRTLTFGVDRMTTIFTKQNVVAQAAGNTIGVGRGIGNRRSN